MARPTPKFLSKSPSRPHASTRTPDSVDPVWLLKGFGVVVLASLICGYLSLCLIFYQGQWQLVLHPSQPASTPIVIPGTRIQTVHFGVDESATPQLTGWWIPAEPLAQYSAFTVLYLASGNGSAAGATEDLAAIHSLGLNVFAFDYRGYGQSAKVHPNQRRMTQDAASAWQYLAISRAIPPGKLIPFGTGVGCFLAAQLAAQHPDVPAVVLDSPRPDLLDVVLADPRVKSLPVRALFHERFDIAQSVAWIKTPKLFLLNVMDIPTGEPLPPPGELQSLINASASPKMTAHLTPSDRKNGVFTAQLSRFLDEYIH